MEMRPKSLRPFSGKNGFKDSSVKWNFQKYLINENGYLEKIISPRTKPDDPSVIEWIKT